MSEPFTPKAARRAQAERRLEELRPRDPNEADVRMRRAEQLRGAPVPQCPPGGWVVFADKASGIQVLEQLNGDIHVVITSRDLASAVFGRVSLMLKGLSASFTTAGDAMNGWRRAHQGLLDGLFTVSVERSYRMPRRRRRKPGPPWRRRRR